MVSLAALLRIGFVWLALGGFYCLGVWFGVFFGACVISCCEVEDRHKKSVFNEPLSTYPFLTC